MSIGSGLVVYTAFGLFFLLLGSEYHDNTLSIVGYSTIVIGILVSVWKCYRAYPKVRYLNIVKRLNK